MDVGVAWNKLSGAEQRNDLVNVLTIVSDIAKKNKVLALSKKPDLRESPIPSGSRMLFSIPSKRIHASVADFMKFYNDPYTLFDSDCSISISPANRW